MTEYLTLIITLFGLGVGSFINVIVSRFQPEISFKFKQLVSGRSRCPFCRHQLTWRDLIPIFSFIFLKRRCRYCGEKISWQYPIIEALTALIFFGIAYRFWHLESIRLVIVSGFIPFWVWLALVVFLFYAAILIILSVIDIKYYLLPDKFILMAGAGALVVDLLFYRISILKNSNFPTCGLNFLSSYINYFNCHFNIIVSYLLGALVIGGFLFLIYIITKGRGMGFGDVKLGILIGLMLGLTNASMALISAFIIGSIIGIILLVLKKKNLKSWIPFGPFLASGVFITIFFGSILVESYLSIFNYLP